MNNTSIGRSRLSNRQMRTRKTKEIDIEEKRLTRQARLSRPRGPKRALRWSVFTMESRISWGFLALFFFCVG